MLIIKYIQVYLKIFNELPLRFICKCSVFYVNSSNDNIIYYHFKILFIIKSKQ